MIVERRVDRRGSYCTVICGGMMRSAHTSVCHSPLVVWRVESSFNWSSSSLGSVGRACSTFCSVLRPSLSELCGGGGEVHVRGVKSCNGEKGG